MIVVENGLIKYGQTVLLKNIELKIESGITAIIGPNGAGKTSLIKVFAKKKNLNEGQLKNDFKKTVLIPQSVEYPKSITLFDYLSCVYFYKKWKWALKKTEKEEIYSTLKEFGLYEKKDILIEKLSGGELQLANTALCSLSNSDLVILDEPGSNLDIKNQIFVCKILRKLSQKGVCIILVIHDINFAAKYADNFILIKRNKEIIYGDKNILSPQNLSESYNFKFREIVFENEKIIHPDI